MVFIELKTTSKGIIRVRADRIIAIRDRAERGSRLYLQGLQESISVAESPETVVGLIAQFTADA